MTAEHAPRTAKKRTTAAKKPAVRNKAAPKEEEKKQPAERKEVKRTFLYAVGRRKTSIARVRCFQKVGGEITVNGKPLASYFPTFQLQSIIMQPIQLSGLSVGEITVKVVGGGVHSQAESVRHGIARVLLLVNPDTRKLLKPAGLLTRDPRVKERKKYGLKRARRS